MSKNAQANPAFPLYLSKEWCQILMGIWVWLRSVNVWSTFFLSAFHLQRLRRVAPAIGNLSGLHGPPKSMLLTLGLIWILNYIYCIPAHIFSTNGDINSTEVSIYYLMFNIVLYCRVDQYLIDAISEITT